MWNRGAIKEKAKGRISVNYWKMVVAGLVAALFTGSGTSYNFNFNSDDADGFGDFISGNIPFMRDSFDFKMLMGLGAMIAVVGIIAVLIAIILSVFVINPLVVGTKRFFYVNIDNVAELRELGTGFETGYRGKVKTMFLKDLYTFLWFLLFIVPGIIKCYEYRMIPYLLAENPDMSTEDAFRISKEMMMGNKWDAFVFDLSYIGWMILSSITLGIVGIFYVNPYYHQGCAMLYDAIKYDWNAKSGDGATVDAEFTEMN